MTVTCSTANVTHCKSLGADEVIDYKTQNVLQALKDSPYKYDLVVDYVGNDHNLFWEADVDTSPNAKFVTVAASHHLSFVQFIMAAEYMPRFLSGAKRQHLTVFAKPNREDLSQIAEWMVEGKVKPVIDSKYKFEDLREVYQRLKTGRARGKLILEVAPEGEHAAYKKCSSKMRPFDTYRMALTIFRAQCPLSCSKIPNEMPPQRRLH